MLTTGYGYYIIGQFFLSALFFLTVGPWNSVVMWSFIHPILMTTSRQASVPTAKKILVGVSIISFILEFARFIFVAIYASELETRTVNLVFAAFLFTYPSTCIFCYLVTYRYANKLIQTIQDLLVTFHPSSGASSESSSIRNPQFSKQKPPKRERLSIGYGSAQESKRKKYEALIANIYQFRNSLMQATIGTFVVYLGVLIGIYYGLGVYPYHFVTWIIIFWSYVGFSFTATRFAYQTYQNLETNKPIVENVPPEPSTGTIAPPVLDIPPSPSSVRWSDRFAWTKRSDSDVGQEGRERNSSRILESVRRHLSKSYSERSNPEAVLVMETITSSPPPRPNTVFLHA
jgi:hypothetical protein